MNENEKKMQELFIQYLAQKSGAKTEDELKKYINSLGKDGIEKAYQEFQKELQAQKMQKGAKLDYLIKLRKHN